LDEEAEESKTDEADDNEMADDDDELVDHDEFLSVSEGEDDGMTLDESLADLEKELEEYAQM